MVQSIIDLGVSEDRVLNIVKAQHGLKNKSQAVAMILNIYQDSFLEPELRPEYIKKLEKINKEKHHGFKDIDDLRKQIEE